MSRTQFLLCFIGVFGTLLTKNVEARLSGEGIIGGDNARNGQFPYHVVLEVAGDSICGGSILSERYVITAAHCVVEDDNSFTGLPIKVVAGVNDLNSNNRVEVVVAQVFVPKEYDPVTADKENLYTIGDIAVLKLKNKLNIKGNYKLGKIKLPNKDETFEGIKADISGFGYNEIDVVIDVNGKAEEKNGKAYNKMRFAEANVISNEACIQVYGDYSIGKQHICAAVEQRNEDHPEGICSGDSGGPLVYNGFQIGVVSVSPFGCREDTYPAVYTRVSNYLEFINKAVIGKSDDNIRTITL